MIRRKRHVDQRGFTDGLAVVERFNRGELKCAFINAVGNLEEDVGTFGRRLGRPGGLSCCGCLDGAIHILGRSVCTKCKQFAGSGVVGFKCCAILCVNPFAVNQKSIAVLQVLRHKNSFPNMLRCRRFLPGRAAAP